MYWDRTQSCKLGLNNFKLFLIQFLLCLHLKKCFLNLASSCLWFFFLFLSLKSALWRYLLSNGQIMLNCIFSILLLIPNLHNVHSKEYRFKRFSAIWVWQAPLICLFNFLSAHIMKLEFIGFYRLTSWMSSLLVWCVCIAGIYNFLFVVYQVGFF